MRSYREINIGGRTYPKNLDVDRYQVPFQELGDLRMVEIPAHSHLEVLDVPVPNNAIGADHYAVNAGDDNDDSELSVYGGPSLKVPNDRLAATMAQVHAAWPDFPRDSTGIIRCPHITETERDSDHTVLSVYLGVNFDGNRQVTVRDAMRVFTDGYERMRRPAVHLFLCHATEDKLAARELASQMKKLGAAVWFDEWEIRVGDSIVQKISDALGKVSHLVVLLSENSVKKPWVTKEFSSALMLQLSQQSIRVLPLRLDDCNIPPILADIKYADARQGVAGAVDDLAKAIFQL